MIQELCTAEYRCPGETYGIPRAVHLGRLANFQPACRECPHRGDTLGLSSRQIRQLAEIGSRAEQPPLFYAEGIGKTAISDLSPEVARRIAIEFARRIVRDRLPATAVVAGDGRLATAAIVAAIVEGIRWAGCEAVDIGPASAPCTARAIEHLTAGGGILVGNPDGEPHRVGLKFWAHGAPLSQGGLLNDIAASLPSGGDGAMLDRPRRTFGRLQTFPAADLYLSDLRTAYHALRPLRFVLDCSAGPILAYLKELIRNVACRIIACKSSRLGAQVVAAQAHLGMRIDDDGENCHVVDERGQSVEAEQLLALIAGNFSGPPMQSEELRQQTFLRMLESRAALALGAAGRLWYAGGHAPFPDALRTLTYLLVLLSRNDLAFSAVLDRKGSAL